ncbi:unnamed protein product [Schistosoma turkestanicum]|nr:unnamed protein product [Schistosoma turkestanicum]
MRPEYYFFSKNHFSLGIIILGIIQITYSQEELEIIRSHIAQCSATTTSIGANLSSCLFCVQNYKKECKTLCASLAEDQDICDRICWRYAKYGTFSCKNNHG